MTTINKSASRIGTVEFPNGNRTELFIGANHNTGHTIVWQRPEGGRASRVTGGNIRRIANELCDAILEGAMFDPDVNELALFALYREGH